MTAFLKGKIIVLIWLWKKRVLGVFFYHLKKKVIFDRYFLCNFCRDDIAIKILKKLTFLKEIILH